jgi:hypothetical protein
LVTVNHITSVANFAYSLYIDNGWTGVQGGPGITISNTLGANNLSDNMQGLYLISRGNILVNGVKSSDTGGSGAHIENSWMSTGTVTITNSQFNENSNYGLTVDSRGNITLTNVQANGNHTGSGAYLYNAYLAGKTVTVSKSSFNDNHGLGLNILAGGNVTLNGIAASYNYYGGLRVVNDYFNTTAAYNVSILSTLGPNMFIYNGSALSYPALTTGDNVFIQTSGNVSVSKALATYSYYDSGFNVKHTGNWSGKTVTFTCSTAQNNYDFGFYVYNSGGTPIKVYFNGSGAAGNWRPFNTYDYYFSGAVTTYYARTNCP